MHILTGILLGLSTLLFIGPVLFYLLKSSIASGFKAGMAVAFGIIVGDVICVFLALFGANYFFTNETNQMWLAFIGGVLLLIIGLRYIFKPDLNIENGKKMSNKSLLLYFTNGFLINFVNPFVFAVWLGFVSYNQSIYGEIETLTSLIITLAVILTTDLLKAYYSQKVLGLIRPERLRVIFKVFGVVMLLFALRLLIYAMF